MNLRCLASLIELMLPSGIFTTLFTVLEGEAVFAKAEPSPAIVWLFGSVNVAVTSLTLLKLYEYSKVKGLVSKLLEDAN